MYLNIFLNFCWANCIYFNYLFQTYHNYKGFHQIYSQIVILKNIILNYKNISRGFYEPYSAKRFLYTIFNVVLFIADFGLVLTELTIEDDLDINLRQLASVLLKQYVDTHWHKNADKVDISNDDWVLKWYCIPVHCNSHIFNFIAQLSINSWSKKNNT